MKNNLLPKNILAKKTVDYTFTIMFFLIFSMFIIFAIRPSLTTATSLKKEEVELQKIDALYEKKIVNIAAIQQLIEENRNEFPLLNQAIAPYPKVNKMIEDIQMIADKNSFVIQKASVADVNLFDTNKKSVEKIQVNVEGTSSFENLMAFIQDLFNQRRLKNIPKMAITNSTDSTESATLKVVLSIDGYYL